MEIYINWTELKTLSQSKKLSLQYYEEDYKYKIFVEEMNNICYYTEIWKDNDKVSGINISQNNADLQDFEDNFKSDSNKNLVNKTIYYYVQNQLSEHFFSRQTDLTNTDFTTLITKTATTGKTFYVTDILISGDSDAELRIKLDAYVVAQHDYTAKKLFVCKRNIPFIVPSGMTIYIQWKPITDGTHASINLSGYEE